MADSTVGVPRRGIGKIAAVFACGTALFSDGYLNGVVGSINTILRRLYKEEYAANNYSQLFSSMGFAGTVFGMLAFGYAADKLGRRFGMFSAAIICIVFTALSAGAYGAGGSTKGLLQALIAYRFLTGIGIGAEYPAGSVAASENTEDPGIKKGWQHMLFALATNCAIDWGFVISAFVPLVLYWIFKEDHLRAVWRGSFLLGVIPPTLILLWRLRVHEPVRFQESSMKNVRTPWLLVLRRYWLRFAGISVAWFIYDWISYPFGLYSSTIVDTITGGDTSLTVVFGWNVVINLFYIPGCMLGALTVDKLGPKNQIMLMLVIQAIVGFIMSGVYVQLTQHIAAFAVVYGLFLTFGEWGPGDCLGLLASKSFPTAVRGQLYGLAAAIGKVGAFVGTYTYPSIIASFPEGPRQQTGPFFIASGLAVFSAIVIFFTIKELPADFMTNEDAEFRSYLEQNGFDTSKMGIFPTETMSSDVERFDKKDNTVARTESGDHSTEEKEH